MNTLMKVAKFLDKKAAQRNAKIKAQNVAKFIGEAAQQDTKTRTQNSASKKGIKKTTVKSFGEARVDKLEMYDDVYYVVVCNLTNSLLDEMLHTELDDAKEEAMSWDE